jgi:hypothetical protein
MRNPEVFEGKNFQDIMREIHEHAANKREQIKMLMDTLSKMITSPHDAAVVAPLVREFMDVAVKNDEHLVKMATIIQRLMTAETHATGHALEELLTEEEKRTLLDEVKASAEEAAVDAVTELEEAIAADEEVRQLTEKTKEAVSKIKKQ